MSSLGINSPGGSLLLLILKGEQGQEDRGRHRINGIKILEAVRMKEPGNSATWGQPGGRDYQGGSGQAGDGAQFRVLA